MLEVRAWALARPIVERDTTEDALATQVGELQKIQDEQGTFSFFGMITSLSIEPFYHLLTSSIPVLSLVFLPTNPSFRDSQNKRD